LAPIESAAALATLVAVVVLLCVLDWRHPAFGVVTPILAALAAWQLARARGARREARLTESERRFRLLIERSNVIVWEYDPALETFTYVSPQAVTLGYPLEQWYTPRFWHEHVHPEDRDRAISYCSAESLAHRDHRFEYRMICADGSIVWIDDFVGVTPRVAQPPLLRGVLIEITAQRQAAQRVAESEERFRRMADASPAMVWTSDPAGNCTYFSAGWTAFTGFSGDQLRADGWLGSVHPEDRERVGGEFASATQARAAYDSTYRLRRKDGLYRWVQDRGGPNVDAQGTYHGYVGLTIDIHEQHEGERALRVARAAAEAANRTKTDFIANMSHEVRTPLTAILGFADLLKDEISVAPEPSHQLQMIETIRSAGGHLLTVINDILDLSKIESGHMTVERIPTHLAQSLAEVEELLRPRANEKGIGLIVRVDSVIPEQVMGDPTRIRQILVNLAGNAIKFTDHGTVTLTVRATQRAGIHRLVIDVLDTGPGMTGDQAAHIFKPFSQADTSVTRRFGGTGLGLSISRKLARLMEGDVQLLHSEPGHGSCFRLELPLKPLDGAAEITSLSEVAPIGTTFESTPSPPMKGRILLAEDGLDNQKLISFHLRKAGATVEVADNGRIALEKIEASHASGTPFDLLVSDMQMPEMDGYTLAKTLREKGLKLPIIALTAHAMSEDRQRCLDAGCDDYATKPIDKKQLLRLCSRWLEGTTGAARAESSAAAA